MSCYAEQTSIIDDNAVGSILTENLRDALSARFGEDLPVGEALVNTDELTRIASRRVHRHYQDRAVDGDLIKLLCACALSAPSKSDLQQADILIVTDPLKRAFLADLLPDQTWMRTAPVFMIVLANGRRLPEIARLRDKPFPNDHLDAFFNCSVDAGIVISAFMNAADSVGLGCCPISVIRDHAETVCSYFALPPRVFPVAGLCVGWPALAGSVSPRLGLASTLHWDAYDEGDLTERIDAFDQRRAATHPLSPRDPATWGEAGFYGWSEDKARQFGVPQCSDFGSFVRKIGFRLD